MTIGPQIRKVKGKVKCKDTNETVFILLQVSDTVMWYVMGVHRRESLVSAGSV